MSIVKAEKHETLRFGVGKAGANGFNGSLAGDNPNRQSGVVILSDIPMGVRVDADVDRPVELTEADLGAAGSAGALAPYKFERAPLPAAFAVGGFQFQTRNRVLLAGPLNGPVSKFQAEPTWVDITQTGSLVQRGRKAHAIDMPGLSAGNANPNQRNLLRLRWTATARAGATFITADGTLKKFAVQLNPSTGDTRIAPGSFASGNVTVAGKTMVVRDDGFGRLFGFTQDTATPPNAVDYVDGVIDYMAGMVYMTFSTAPTAGTITAGYEWGCTYIPIDLYATWPTLLQ